MDSVVKRLVTLSLCAAMLTSLLASCAENKDDQGNRKVPGNTSAVEENMPTFVEDKFEGETFIICSPMDDAPDFGDNYIDNDQLTGEPINDAVIDRNRAVEEKYGIDIIQRNQDSGYASQASKSGTVDFDLVYDWGIRLVPAAMEGVYYDLLSVPNLNLEQDYWAPSTQRDLTIANKLLIWTSDVSMNRIGYASFIAFNKELLDRFKLEYPYELVNKNEWTCDKLIEMFSQVAVDVNGDQTWGVEDIYGISGYAPGSIISSAGLPTTFTIKNDDGTYTVNVYSEKLKQIYDKYAKSLSTNNSICKLEWQNWIKGRDISKYDSQFQAGRLISFGEGHYAFKGTSMTYIPELVAEGLDFQFGVVPNPKYEATQEGYYHFIDSCAPMFSIPKQAPDMEKVGAILEYLTYQSKKCLLPAYYEQTIKTKCMSDPEGRDEKMLDIVRGSVYYSWTGLYYQGIPKQGTGNDKTWDPIGTMYHAMISAGNFQSVNNKYKAAVQKSLDDFYDIILQMDLDK